MINLKLTLYCGGGKLFNVLRHKRRDYFTHYIPVFYLYRLFPQRCANGWRKEKRREMR